MMTVMILAISSSSNRAIDLFGVCLCPLADRQVEEESNARLYEGEAGGGIDYVCQFGNGF